MIRHVGTLFITSLGVCVAACSGGGNKSTDGDRVPALLSDAETDGAMVASGGALGAGSTALGGTIPPGGNTGTGGMLGSGGSGFGQVAGSGGSIAMDAKLPAAIDLSIWSLQLPSGTGTSPTIISPKQLLAGFSNDYFYEAADGGLVFMDPATGVTTSGSLHCRTELREMTATGGNAAWAATGTNTMAVSGRVVQVGGGSSGRTTVAQVFNSDDSIPLCELEYSNSLGGFELLYEEASGAGTYVDLKTPVALGSQYAYTLSLSNGVLAVSINGNDVYARTPSATILAKTFYFKCGNYDQTATAGALSTTPYSVVENYDIAVVHR